MLGGHTLNQIADLLDLSRPDTATLLRDVLHRLRELLQSRDLSPA